MDERPPSLGGPDPRARSDFMRSRRRLGWALVGLSAVLTVWSLSRPPPPVDAGTCGPEAPVDAAAVTLPLERADALSPLLGRVVCFTHDLVVTEVFDLGRHGELLLADRRLFAPHTGLGVPDPSLHVVRLSPGAVATDPWPLPWGLDVGDVRVGDAVKRLVGTLERSPRGGYAVVPDAAPSFETRNPPPADPPEVGGGLRIATLNVFNYFVTIGERGAQSPRELERQTTKLVAALVGLDADLIALVEVENDDGEALAALVEALGRELAAQGVRRTYRSPPPPAEGTGRDAVRQAFLYDPARVEVLAVGADTDPIHLRAPQSLTVREAGSERVLSVIAVHHRSKGGCPTAGDVDAGYGCWNLQRTAQSEALLRFAASLAEATGSEELLVIGDLNAHRHEPPLTLFEREDAGEHAVEGGRSWRVLTDLVPPEAAYSYVYFGLSAAIDHAIATVPLAERVSGAAYWAINADEPPLADYRTRLNPPEAYRPDPYRSSDHDPLLLGLEGAPARAPPRRQRAGSRSRSREASSRRRASQSSPSRQAVR